MGLPLTVQLALGLHLIIEIPASINFMLRPSSTLVTSQPHSHGVIRQYATLLMVTNLIVILCLTGTIEENAARKIAGALSFYHLAPLMRATSKIRRRLQVSDAMGGPWVHLIVHGICAIALVMAFMGDYFSTIAG